MSVNPPFVPSHATVKAVVLSSLNHGEWGEIVEIDEPELEVALLKMGIAVGDSVKFAFAAPFKGPIAVKANHTKLSLRLEDASHIWINRR